MYGARSPPGKRVAEERLGDPMGQPTPATVAGRPERRVGWACGGPTSTTS